MSDVLMECGFEGVEVQVYCLDEYPDGNSKDTSNFYKGFIEVVILGDGTDPYFQWRQWRIIFVTPKYNPLLLSEQVQDSLVIMTEPHACFHNVEIGNGSLRERSKDARHRVALIDFRLPDDEIITRIIYLGIHSDSVEIPDETLQ